MSEETATCRGCGIVLDGKPYYMGGSAYHPRTRERVLTNFYGGYVCSQSCDRNAAMDLEASMPGSGGYRGSFCMAYQDRAAFRRKWEGMKCA